VPPGRNQADEELSDVTMNSTIFRVAENKKKRERLKKITLEAQAERGPLPYTGSRENNGRNNESRKGRENWLLVGQSTFSKKEEDKLSTLHPATRRRETTT